jgi:hypothetical protein
MGLCLRSLQRRNNVHQVAGGAQDGYAVRSRPYAGTIQGNEDRVRLHTPAIDQHLVAAGSAQDTYAILEKHHKHFYFILFYFILNIV